MMSNIAGLVIAATACYLSQLSLLRSVDGMPAAQTRNTRPVVKIVEPESNSVYPANSLVRYAITVSDEEDGDSRFHEIQNDKIFLEVRFMKTPGAAQEAIDPPGLANIKRSDCFSCHQFNGKLLGPSFAEIPRGMPATNTPEN